MLRIVLDPLLENRQQFLRGSPVGEYQIYIAEALLVLGVALPQPIQDLGVGTCHTGLLAP
ncbi:Uncharacterised protein [Mycobacteroides abscessus subsp. abscessus]|nr:Uncharacterised protein [Mycobacteroides abscessus subsp. abscessus]